MTPLGVPMLGEVLGCVGVVLLPGGELVVCLFSRDTFLTTKIHG